MQKRYSLFILVYLIFLYQGYSQSQFLDFNSPTQSCLQENIIIRNSSTGFKDYEWDFCEGDLSLSPRVTTKQDSKFNVPIGSSFISSNGKWYGFICNLSGNSIVRLDFGESLNNLSPTITNLGNIGGLLHAPQDIKAIEYKNEKILFVNNRGSNKLIRINLGTNIESTTAISNIILTGSGFDNGGLDVSYDGVNWVASITNNTTLTLVNLGSSPKNNPLAENILNTSVIPGISGIGDVKFIQDQGVWYGFVVGFSSRTLHRLKFGQSLFTNPIATQLTVPSLSSFSPYSLVVEKDKGEWIIFTSTSQGSFLRVNLNLVENNEPTFTNLGHFGSLGNNLKLDIARSDSRWVGLTTSWSSNNYSLIEFQQSSCAFDIIASRKFEPGTLKTLLTGKQFISLYARDSLGISKTLSKHLDISTFEAPIFTFLTDNSCITSSNIFNTSISNNQTITSWKWNFGDGNTASVQNPVHQYTTPGTYKVKLEVVSENGCKNFIQKDIKIYPVPTPDFSFPAGIICTNGSITFTNTIPGDYGNLITYEWNFGDGNTSTAKNPSHTYTTGGTKTVTLKASIPGCSASKSYDITILAGPDVNFTEANLCQGDLTQFTDLSTGAGITKYDWDLGNGYTSTLQNPSVIYEAPGKYNVKLTVENASGCKNTFIKPITINALPQVNFINELACSGGPTQFYDKTVIPEANIENWLWEMDGKTYDVKDPAHTFSQAGDYNVKLTITSNFGCKESRSKVITVLPGPTADFSVAEGCMGGATVFTDTSVDKDGSILEWFWQINGQEFYTQNPEYVFETAGTYDVSLTITSGSFCQATVVKQVVINPLPVADFTYTAACAGDAITFKDNSSITGDDSIISRKWKFNDQSSAEGSEATFTYASAGNQQVTLEITTERGCVITSQKTIEVTPVPVVSFSVPSTLGAPPLTIQFNNTSIGENNYTWYFGDAKQSSSTEKSPSFVYNELGEYQVSLVAINALGCSDTSRVTINLINPIVDLSLEQLSVVTTGNHKQIVLQISNKGSIPINEMDIMVELGNDFSLKEPYSGTINPKETINYLLAFELTEHTFTSLPYICVELQPKHPEYVETNTVDNKVCYDKTNNFRVYDLGPNPTSGELRVSYILPVKDKVSFSIHNSMGALVLQKDVSDTRTGYNAFLFDLGHLNNGIYILVTSYQGKKTTRRIVKE